MQTDEAAGRAPIRLNKLIALNGIASRRRADELIQAGSVMIDGRIVTDLGVKVDPAVQRVEIDGVLLKAEGERHRYYLLNKPAGVVCTNDERELRRRAIDLITDRRKGRIYTVGRLDEETTGLVILTNDGDFAYRISHPRHGVAKTYQVVVAGRIPDEDVRQLRAGVRLAEFKTDFARVSVVKRSERQSVVRVVLGEGRNREVRRAFARLGLRVKGLRRTNIGPVDERGLKPGHWRLLDKHEVEALSRLADGLEPLPEPRRRPQRGTRKPRAFGGGRRR